MNEFQRIDKTNQCHKCQSEDLVKNGTNASGSSQYHCKACGVYGVLERTERATEEKKELIINVYQERSSMRGIERTFGGLAPNIECLVKRTGE